MTLAALLYLATPGLLFLGFFVMPALGVPLALALAAALLHLAHRRLPARAAGTPVADGAPPPAVRSPATAMALLLAVAVTATMGFASGHYNWDWIKHWALLNTLHSQPWPVELVLQGTPGYLRFYIGAYLLPAGLAHISGWSLVACTAAWYGLGLLLAFRLLGASPRAAGSRWHSTLALPLLLCMAGADAWLHGLLRPASSPIGFSGLHHEWWANALLDHPLQYASPLSLLLWVPHQAVPAFIVVGLLRRLGSAGDIGPVVLATGLLALWSPYALIGSLPLLLAQLLGQGQLRQALRHPSAGLVGTGLVASAFAALLAWTLMHEVPKAGLCLACAPERLARPAEHLLFLAVELGMPLLLLRRRLCNDATSLAAVSTLLILPWLGGAVPDAVMRVSMPALVWLFMRCADELAQSPPRQRAAGVLLVLVLGGPTVWGEIGFHLEGGARHRALPAADPLAAPHFTIWATRSTYTAQAFFERCGWKWRPQYFAASPPPTWPARARDGDLTNFAPVPISPSVSKPQELSDRP